MNKFIHPIDPIYNKDSEILILGSFPSITSRNNLSYYAHPKNQFWLIMQDIFNESIVNKKQFLLKHHIALWDVIKNCDIKGSKDISIKNVEVNDIKKIIQNSNIKYIFTTGKKAYTLYKKYLENDLGIKAIYLPSTSPIYASMCYNDKLKEYIKIKNYLNNK